MADPITRAAVAILNADALLVCTGAGMGVDSGLGTFRGRHAGVWAPLKALGIDYIDICCPRHFESDPRLSWAFWLHCYNAYTKGAPHEGYAILSGWGNARKYPMFSVTSNIDGHWARTPGVGAERVYEVHGAVTHMQILHEREDAGPHEIVVTDAAQMDAMTIPPWELSAGDEVEVAIGDGPLGPGTVWVPGVVGEDGMSVALAADQKKKDRCGVRRDGQGPDLAHVLESCPLPTLYGLPARPNVYMFGDQGMDWTRVEEQEQKYRAWKRSLPRDAKLVIVEIGAGKTIPTIRQTSEEMVRSRPANTTTLVRINLDDSDVPEGMEECSVRVGGLGALEALRRIQASMERRSSLPS